MPESEDRYGVCTCKIAWLPRPGPRRRGQRARRSGESGAVATNAQCRDPPILRAAAAGGRPHPPPTRSRYATEGAAERAAADPLLRPTVWTAAAAAAAADDVPLRGHLEHRR